MTIKQTSLNETGVTLETVIISAIGVLVATGAGVIIYNALRARIENIAIAAQQVQTLTPIAEPGGPTTKPCRGHQIALERECPTELFKEIDLGDGHGCLISDYPLDANGAWDPTGIAVAGQVYCWGSNEFGQLGNAELGVSGNANPHQLIKSDISGVSQISAGGSRINYHSAAEIAPSQHTCALKVNDVLCWGSNRYGQLGARNIGITDASTLSDFQHLEDNRVAPVVTTLGSGVTQIEADGRVTCVVQSGQVKCWGLGSRNCPSCGKHTSFRANGRFPADPQKDHIPFPIIEDGGDTALTGVDAIDISEGDTSCALKDGDLYCWGRGAIAGSIFDETYFPSTDWSGRTELGLGAGFSSALNTTAKAVKVKGVPDDINIREIAINNFDLGICAIADHPTQSIVGGVWCWEYALQDTGPTTGNDSYIEMVEIDGAPITGALGIAFGENRRCVILSNKTLACWGDFNKSASFWPNASNLGSDAIVALSSHKVTLRPTVIPGTTNIEKIFSMYRSACIINDNDELKCFGRPRYLGPFEDSTIQAALGHTS